MPSGIAGPLLAWFSRHGRRHLPWRTDRTPYRVAVAESMLQQTQVERVVPIFERFVAIWPAFSALAAASQADVVRAWRGLGYNSRAVRSHRLAKIVAQRHGGGLPADEAVLRGLPGVGPYTARAIAAFAFDADVIAFDTNVRRIVHRTQLGLEWPARANARELDALGAQLVPSGFGFSFNSALMDLGSMLCTARAPKCLLCPLQPVCAAAPVDAGRLAALAAKHGVPRAPQERLGFERTTRYARGRVIDRLRALAPDERISLLDLHDQLRAQLLHHGDAAVKRVVDDLECEGVVECADGSVRLAQ